MDPMSMVVRLLGDASSFVGMVRQAQDAVGKVAQDVESAAARIESIGQSITRFAQSALQGIAALGVKGRLDEAFQMYERQELVEIRLKAALRASGQEVEQNYRRLTDYAQALSQVTIYSSQATMELMQEAVSMGLSAGQAERATKSALAFADAENISIASALRLTAGLERGVTQGFNRYFKQLSRIKDPVMAVHYVQGKMNEMLHVSTEVAGTTSGRLQQLQNSINGLKKEFGAIVAEGIKPFIDPLKRVVEWVRALSPETKRLAVVLASFYSTLLLIGPALRLLSVLGFAFFNPLTILLTAAAAATYYWTQEVGGIGPAWAQVKAIVLPALESTWDWLVQVGAATWDLIKTYRETAFVVGTVTGAVLLGVAAYKLLVLVVGLVTGIMTALHVQQIVSIGLWVAWQAVLLSTKAVMLLFTAVQGALAIAFGAVDIAIAATTALLAGLQAAVMAVLSVLVAGTITVGLLGIAFIGIYGAVEAARGVLYDLFKIFDQTPYRAGPLEVITDIFKEWWDVLKLVYRAMAVDMKLAWQIVQAGAELAGAQLAALWPPLWKFIRDGWTALSTFIAAEFENKFFLAVVRVQQRLIGFLDPFGIFKDMIEKIKKGIEDQANVQTFINLDKAKKDLAAVMEAFKYEETDAVRDAREKVRKLTEELEQKERDAAKRKEDKQKKFNDALGQEYQMKQALKMQNAALFQSAEALYRVTQYKEQLLYGTGGGFYAGKPIAPAGAGAGALAAQTAYGQAVQADKARGGPGFIPRAPGTILPGSPGTPIIMPGPGAPGGPPAPMTPVPNPATPREDQYKNAVIARLDALVKLTADIAKKPVPNIPPADFK